MGEKHPQCRLRGTPALAEMRGRHNPLQGSLPAPCSLSDPIPVPLSMALPKIRSRCGWYVSSFADHFQVELQ